MVTKPSHGRPSMTKQSLMMACILLFIARIAFSSDLAWTDADDYTVEGRSF